MASDMKAEMYIYHCIYKYSPTFTEGLQKVNSWRVHSEAVGNVIQQWEQWYKWQVTFKTQNDEKEVPVALWLTSWTAAL